MYDEGDNFRLFRFGPFVTEFGIDCDIDTFLVVFMIEFDAEIELEFNLRFILGYLDWICYVNAHRY